MTRPWPWGLTVLSDPDDRSVVPTTLGAEAVVRGEGTVVCRVLHAVDGEATATATLDTVTAEAQMLLVHHGPLELTSGLLRLGDAANEEAVECAVVPGPYIVRVLVNALDHPTQVLFALTR